MGGLPMQVDDYIPRCNYCGSIYHEEFRCPIKIERMNIITNCPYTLKELRMAERNSDMIKEMDMRAFNYWIQSLEVGEWEV